MEYVSGVTKPVVHCVVPDDRASAEQKGIAVPSEVNVTVPVGVGGPAGVTVAVKSIYNPATDGFRLDVRAVVELAFTSCDSAALVLAR